MGNTFRVAALFVVSMALSVTTALAQSAVPDEGVSPDGHVVSGLTLTPAQRNAIYNAVFRERLKPSPVTIAATVGAPVPQTADLTDLPNAATGDNPQAADLKYAMVDRDVVVVDPVRMRVIDVIHDGTVPQ